MTSPGPLSEQLQAIGERLEAALAEVTSHAMLEDVRVRFLGRSGEITTVRRSIGALPPAERPGAGKVVNDATNGFEATLERKRVELESRALEERLNAAIDVTFPGVHPRTGALHPVRQTMDDIVSYFERRGFAIATGPEIESEYNNFDALNIPPEHPAREGLDSFYLEPGFVLRTHTSPVQIRTMQQCRPPVALVVPGRVYRRDSLDARHLFAFHQVEGLQVGAGLHMGHLKAVLSGLFGDLFGGESAVRLRPSFFPFTEPSAEVDAVCPACRGAGCRTCGGSGWLEMCGAGMVHPAVLREVGYDPNAVSGWAFGIGVERVALTRYGVDDIRVFTENDPAVLGSLV